MNVSVNDPTSSTPVQQTPNWGYNANVNIDSQTYVARNSGGGAWDAGCSSTGHIDNNGYLTFTAMTGKQMVCGLYNSTWTTGTPYNVNFGLYFNGSGNVYAWEWGGGKTGYSIIDSSYTTSTVWKIAIDGNLVRYYKDGALIYTSVHDALVRPLNIIMDFYTNTGWFNNIALYNTPGLIAAESIDVALSTQIWEDIHGARLYADQRSLLRTLPGAGWEGTMARSRSTIEADGFVEFTFDAWVGYNAMVGLGYSSAVYETYVFGGYFNWYSILDGTPKAFLYEYPFSSTPDYGVVTNASLFRIQVRRGVVTYSIDNVVKYTSLVKAYVAAPLKVTYSGYSTASTVSDVAITKTVDVADTNTFWYDVANCTTTATSITRNLANNGVYVGGYVLGVINGDGYVEFKASLFEMAGNVGLADGEGLAADYLNYSICCSNAVTPAYEVKENGTYHDPGSSWPAYVANSSVFKIARVGTTVRYYKDGGLVYTSTTSSTGRLIVCFQIYDNTRGFSAITVSGSDANAVVVTDSVLTRGENAHWRNIVGVATTAHGMTKVGGYEPWACGATSKQTISSNGGYVEFKTSENGVSKYKVCGLNTYHGDQEFTQVNYQYGVYLYEDSAYIIENGAYVAVITEGFSVDDVFKIAVTSHGIVSYYRNGVLAYTSQTIATLPMVVDAGIHTVSSTLTNINITQAVGVPVSIAHTIHVNFGG